METVANHAKKGDGVDFSWEVEEYGGMEAEKSRGSCMELFFGDPNVARCEVSSNSLPYTPSTYCPGFAMICHRGS